MLRSFCKLIDLFLSVYFIVYASLAKAENSLTNDEYMRIGNELGETESSIFNKNKAKEIDKIKEEQESLRRKAIDKFKSGGTKVDIDTPKLKNEIVEVNKPHIVPKFESSNIKTPEIEAGSIFVFITLSMKDDEIAKYMVEAERFNATLVIRGLEKGGIKKTGLRIQKIVEKSKTGGVEIDPVKFRMFKIKHAPSFVMTTEKSTICLESTCKAPRHVTAKGSVSIEYFLEMASKVGSKESQDFAHAALRRRQ